MLEIKTNDAESAAKIIVVGVGGAGNNAVNRMIDEAIEGVEFIGITPINRLCSCARPQDFYRLGKSSPKVWVQEQNRRLVRRPLKKAMKRLRNH